MCTYMLFVSKMHNAFNIYLVVTDGLQCPSEIIVKLYCTLTIYDFMNNTILSNRLCNLKNNYYGFIGQFNRNQEYALLIAT